MLMGCYGIGVTRVVAAAIEQNHDERGIIWPEPIAPFDVSLVPINLQKSARGARGRRAALRRSCTAAGIEVLFDDRDARPGVKFADAELLGIPHRIVVGDAGSRPASSSTATGATPSRRTFRSTGCVGFLRSRQSQAAG